MTSLSALPLIVFSWPVILSRYRRETMALSVDWSEADRLARDTDQAK